MPEENRLEKRLGPFARDLSRTPPTKQQRLKDYQPEKKETGEALKHERLTGWTFAVIVFRGGRTGARQARVARRFASPLRQQPTCGH